MTDQQMMLVAGAGLFTAYFIYKKIKMGGNKVKLKEMLKQGAKVIDVRSKGEFAGGSFPGAINIPLDELSAKVNSIGAETVVISSEASALKEAHRAIKIPERIPELLSPIPYIIPAQLFAAFLADAKGLSPDQPRSLSKVTKTV